MSPHPKALSNPVVSESTGKPLGGRPVRLPGQALSSALQEWELAEIPKGHPGTTEPLYCQRGFDAVTMGKTGLFSHNSGISVQTRITYSFGI